MFSIYSFYDQLSILFTRFELASYVEDLVWNDDMFVLLLIVQPIFVFIFSSRGIIVIDLSYLLFYYSLLFLLLLFLKSAE